MRPQVCRCSCVLPLYAVLLLIGLLIFLSLSTRRQSHEPEIKNHFGASRQVVSRPLQFGMTVILVWHGLGDNFSGSATKLVLDVAQSVYSNHDKGLAVLPIKLDEDPTKDGLATVEGNVLKQLESICENLSNSGLVRNAEMIHAVGFSQGGLFLRALASQCAGFRIRTLVTFGAPHQGVWTLPSQACSAPWLGWLCKTPALLSGAYFSWIQNRLVPATYLKMPDYQERYRKNSHLLAFLNDEHDETLETSRWLKSFPRVTLQMRLNDRLDRLVLVMFRNDTKLMPSDSAWFSDIGSQNPDGTWNTVALRETSLYTEDRIGLRTLDNSGNLISIALPGEHLNISEADMYDIISEHMVNV